MVLPSILTLHPNIIYNIIYFLSTIKLPAISDINLTQVWVHTTIVKCKYDSIIFQFANLLLLSRPNEVEPCTKHTCPSFDILLHLWLYFLVLCYETPNILAIQFNEISWMCHILMGIPVCDAFTATFRTFYHVLCLNNFHNFLIWTQKGSFPQCHPYTLSWCFLFVSFMLHFVYLSFATLYFKLEQACGPINLWNPSSSRLYLSHLHSE